VDDHSTDKTREVILDFQSQNVKYLALSDYLDGRQINSYKKAAITYGITQSTGELIITTDADCFAPSSWLKTIAAFYEAQHPAMIVAPVVYRCSNKILHIFQHLDFMTMQGITAATLALKLGNMCNGANLAFSRAIFEEAGGYTGADNLASGDDYLLMNKIAKMPGQKIAYLKSEAAIMPTQPQQTWQDLLSQRIRWASKSGKYDDKKLTAVLMLVYGFNLAILLLLLAGFWYLPLMKVFCCILPVKILAEYCFLIPVARFYRESKRLWYFPFLQPLHIIYIVLAGFLGFVGKYKWKGRDVR